ncbi:MAG: hypothetical protein J6X95_10195 [Treponema sp.]|nr:hypothetical protein [Treponema sp.]
MEIPEFGKKVRRLVTVGGKKIAMILELCIVEKYDERGNEIYRKYYGHDDFYDGIVEDSMEYDKHNNRILEKKSYLSNGAERNWEREFDDRGNVIHSKDSYGYEEWYEYDERGNEILDRDSEGGLTWYEIEYDENGKKRIVLTFCKVYYGVFSVLRRVRKGISKRFKKFQKRQTHNARRKSEKRLRKN